MNENDKARALEEQAGASAPSAQTVQRKVERARQLRRAIAAAAALAVMAEEIAQSHLGAGYEEAIDWIYGERLIQPAGAKPASGETHDR